MSLPKSSKKRLPKTLKGEAFYGLFTPSLYRHGFLEECDRDLYNTWIKERDSPTTTIEKRNELEEALNFYDAYNTKFSGLFSLEGTPELERKKIYQANYKRRWDALRVTNPTEYSKLEKIINSSWDGPESTYEDSLITLIDAFNMKKVK